MHVQSYIGYTHFDWRKTMKTIGLLTLLDTKTYCSHPPQLLGRPFQSLQPRHLWNRQIKWKQNCAQWLYVDYTTGLANKARLFEVVNMRLLVVEKQISMRLTDVNLILIGSTNINRESRLRRRVNRFAWTLATFNANIKRVIFFFARNGGGWIWLCIFHVLAYRHYRHLWIVQWGRSERFCVVVGKLGSQLVSLDFSIGAVAYFRNKQGKYDVVQLRWELRFHNQNQKAEDAILLNPTSRSLRASVQYIESSITYFALKNIGPIEFSYQLKLTKTARLFGGRSLASVASIKPWALFSPAGVYHSRIWVT